METYQAYRLTDYDRWFRYHMPYLLKHLDGDIYLPLNRDYKPLGMIAKDWVRYEDYAISHGMTFTRDPRTYVDVWCSNTPPLYFYNDHPKSRVTYFQRLDKLMRRSVKVANTQAVKNLDPW